MQSWQKESPLSNSKPTNKSHPLRRVAFFIP